VVLLKYLEHDHTRPPIFTRCFLYARFLGGL
jgi:hypothetical protein